MRCCWKSSLTKVLEGRSQTHSGHLRVPIPLQKFQTFQNLQPAWGYSLHTQRRVEDPDMSNLLALQGSANAKIKRAAKRCTRVEARDGPPSVLFIGYSQFRMSADKLLQSFLPMFQAPPPMLAPAVQVQGLKEKRQQKKAQEIEKALAVAYDEEEKMLEHQTKMHTALDAAHLTLYDQYPERSIKKVFMRAAVNVYIEHAVGILETKSTRTSYHPAAMCATFDSLLQQLKEMHSATTDDMMGGIDFDVTGYYIEASDAFSRVPMHVPRYCYEEWFVKTVRHGQQDVIDLKLVFEVRAKRPGFR